MHGSIPKGERWSIGILPNKLTYLHVVATIFTINIVHDIGFSTIA